MKTTLLLQIVARALDAAVMAQPEIVMGGGNRSSKIRLEPKELLKLPRVRVVGGLAKPVA